jgi:hypothetical protein
MKHWLSLVAFPLLASLASAPLTQELEFGVSKGTKLAKEFTMSLEFEKKDVSLTLGGRELPKELQEKIEMSMSFEESIAFEDEYVEIDGARPKELVRRFKKAERNSSEHTVMMGSPPKDKKETQESPLVDHEVAFTWNAKDEQYERAFRGDKADAKWLEKLKEDTDLRKVLPEGSVKVGDTWKLDPKVFDSIFVPGGNLHYKSEHEAQDDKDDDDSNFDLDKNATGEIEAKFEAKREVDGVELAVITVKGHVATHTDKPTKDEVPMKMEASFDVEGEFLWDLEHKHFRSYEMHGPAELTVSGGTEVDVNGQKMEMKLRFELEGELKGSGTFGG